MILHLPIEPIGCPRPRATIRGGHAGVYMPSSYRKWQARCAVAFHQRLALPHRTGALDWIDRGKITIIAVFPRTATKPKGTDSAAWKAGGRVPFSRFDADNVGKAVMDALQMSMRDFLKVKWDDKKMEIGGIERWYAAVNEDAHIRVTLEKANK